MPRQIAEVNGLVVFDDARHSNRDNIDAGHDEVDFNLLAQNGIEFSLIIDSGKFDGMKKLAVLVEQGK